MRQTLDMKYDDCWDARPVSVLSQACCENATFGSSLTPSMNLMNKPLNVMFLHCPHLQLHPFIPSYGKWLPGTIDIFPSTERARAHHYITSPSLAPSSLSENE